MYYIEKIEYSGSQVKTVSVEFQKGLNIIHGPSDTGKSYIAETISFMTGSKTCRIDPATKYTQVTLYLNVDDYSIKMDRNMDGGDFAVTSTYPGIHSGTYKPTAQGKESISDVWLAAMGIRGREQILKSAEYGHQTLSIRTMFHLYDVDEDAIARKESILFPQHDFTNMSSQSAILYMLLGRTNWDGIEHETKKDRDKKKQAQIEYLTQYINDVKVKRDEIGNVSQFNQGELKSRMQEIMTEIDSAEGEISIAVNESRELAKQINILDKKISEGIMMMERYRVLQKQYESDISRLTFIVEGEVNHTVLPKISRCPFCNGELARKEEESCVEAAKVEVERIVPQINDLDDAMSDLQEELDCLKSDREELEGQRQEKEDFINSELNPMVDELRRTLDEYTNKLQMFQEHKTYSSVIEDMGIRLRNLEDTVNQKEHYDIKADYDAQSFIDDFGELVFNILKECEFDGLESAIFSFSDFDIKVNNKAKFRYGQGYRAFINTVVLLAIHEYLHQKGTYSIGMLVVDSPTLTLKEHPVEDAASDGMKKALFKYMAKHQRQDQQIIIIENDIPDIDYQKYGVRTIKFTGKKGEGRYGLLDNVF